MPAGRQAGRRAGNGRRQHGGGLDQERFSRERTRRCSKDSRARPSEWTEHLQRLGQLYVLGAAIEWPAVWSTPGRKISLPTYPFESQRYWFTAAGRGGDEPVLGSRAWRSIRSWAGGWIWPVTNSCTKRT